MRTDAGRSSVRLAAGAVAVFAAVGGLVVAARGGGDSGFDRTGSQLLDAHPAGLLEPQEAPAAYRIDYRVEAYGGDEPVVTSDRLWVRRPFESRLEVYDGPEPSGRPSAVQVGSLGGFRAEGDRREAVVVAAVPGPPASDVRVAPALPDALARGRVELVEWRTVLGRRCHIVRSAAPLATAELGAPERDGEHTDTCIDATGLVLEELVVDGGRPLLRRVAIDLEVAPDVDAVSFETGEHTLEVDQGGGFVAETEPRSRVPGRFFEATAPAGFQRAGRFAVVPPQPDRFGDVRRRGERVTQISDVFVDGADVVVLDQGGTLGGVDPFPDLDGVAVDVDGFGEASLGHGLAGSRIVIVLGEGRFLRARGTVAPDVLLDLLEALDEVPGGELRLLEPTRGP